MGHGSGTRRSVVGLSVNKATVTQHIECGSAEKLKRNVNKWKLETGQEKLVIMIQDMETGNETRKMHWKRDMEIGNWELELRSTNGNRKLEIGNWKHSMETRK